MCGIAGFVRLRGGEPRLADIKQMTDAVSHRGPDGEGHFIEESVALGHRRLSILDLTEHGAQPMFGPGDRHVVVFNGEIYNYLEVRQELLQFGYCFQTESDTEVLLAAYHKWGEDCVSRFNGMWAFAIYDRQQRTLLVSRDRFGVKPFYYIQNDDVFAFGSEIRQLLKFQKSVKVNLDIARTFLVTDAAEISDESFFAGVLRLPPGHSAVFDLQNKRLSIRRYYELTQDPDAAGLCVDDALERFTALFEDAIRLRLRSDVKVGTCLSGGMDSSSVATVASELYRHTATGKFAAITAVSEQESNSEAHFAEMIVNANDLDWYQVKPGYEDFVSSLPRVVRSQEEPFGGPSITMQHFVMQNARSNGITVLLDGQGGDETLLGYEKYYASYILSSLRNDGIAATLSALRASARNNSKMGAVNMVKYLVGGVVAPARYQFYKRRHRHFSAHIPTPPHISAYAKSNYDSFKLQKLEIESTNLPVLLRYEDKNSMAHGVETRLPFLDYRLLRFSLSLPGRYKIHDGWSKWILRKAMEKRLPNAVTWRKNKFGFEAPEDLWLGMHSKEMAAAVISSPILTELAPKRALAAAMQRLDKRSRWRLYSLALWEREFSVTR